MFWTAQDYNTYALEYGRNNLDNEYPMAYFEFDKSEITTDGSEANLVAASANSTHLTMRLQVTPAPLLFHMHGR
jgi:hypothetical protein